MNLFNRMRPVWINFKNFVMNLFNRMRPEERPVWINFKNFVALLGQKDIQERLSEDVRKKYAKDGDGYILGSQEEDAIVFFPLFLADVRMFDISERRY